MQISINDILLMQIFQTMYDLKSKILNLIDKIEQLPIVKYYSLKIGSITEFLDQVMGHFVPALSFLQHVVTGFGKCWLV